MPIFGGQKGPEISESLSEIESTFNRHLLELRRFKDIILDVKATSWHEYYNKYEKEEDTDYLIKSICYKFIVLKIPFGR